MSVTGQGPLQWYWFHAAARYFNSLLCRSSGVLKMIVHADIALFKKCWTAEFIEACEGLRASKMGLSADQGAVYS